jgi:hypothetical protein
MTSFRYTLKLIECVPIDYNIMSMRPDPVSDLNPESYVRMRKLLNPSRSVSTILVKTCEMLLCRVPRFARIGFSNEVVHYL